MKSSAYPSFTALGSHILRQRFVSVEAHIALMTLPSRPLPHRSDAGVGCRNHGANADLFAVTLGLRLNSSEFASSADFTRCLIPKSSHLLRSYPPFHSQRSVFKF